MEAGAEELRERRRRRSSVRVVAPDDPMSPKSTKSAAPADGAAGGGPSAPPNQQTQPKQAPAPAQGPTATQQQDQQNNATHHAPHAPSDAKKGGSSPRPPPQKQQQQQQQQQPKPQPLSSTESGVTGSSSSDKKRQADSKAQEHDKVSLPELHNSRTTESSVPAVSPSQSASNESAHAASLPQPGRRRSPQPAKKNNANQMAVFLPDTDAQNNFLPDDTEVVINKGAYTNPSAAGGHMNFAFTNYNAPMPQQPMFPMNGGVGMPMGVGGGGHPNPNVVRSATSQMMLPQAFLRPPTGTQYTNYSNNSNYNYAPNKDTQKANSEGDTSGSGSSDKDDEDESDLSATLHSNSAPPGLGGGGGASDAKTGRIHSDVPDIDAMLNSSDADVTASPKASKKKTGEAASPTTKAAAGKKQGGYVPSSLLNYDTVPDDSEQRGEKPMEAASPVTATPAKRNTKGGLAKTASTTNYSLLTDGMIPPEDTDTSVTTDSAKNTKAAASAPRSGSIDKKATSTPTTANASQPVYSFLNDAMIPTEDETVKGERSNSHQQHPPTNVLAENAKLKRQQVAQRRRSNSQAATPTKHAAGDKTKPSPASADTKPIYSMLGADMIPTEDETVKKDKSLTTSNAKSNSGTASPVLDTASASPKTLPTAGSTLSPSSSKADGRLRGSLPESGFALYQPSANSNEPAAANASSGHLAPSEVSTTFSSRNLAGKKVSALVSRYETPGEVARIRGSNRDELNDSDRYFLELASNPDVASKEGTAAGESGQERQHPADKSFPSVASYDMKMM